MPAASVSTSAGSSAGRVPDVAIIGAGPGGATLAALLAGNGWDVLVLEKAHHPRFHIGESLLPANVALFERLGVLEKVRELGLPKSGADFNTFLHEYDPPRHDARFANQLDRNKADYAFEVRRSEFDHMLVEHARSAGAEVREGTTVTRVDFPADGDPAVHVRNDEGGSEAIEARFIVDASGRDTVLANHFESKRQNRKHKSAALYAHFGNVTLREGECAGNISIYWFEHGWIWFIPLRDGAMSIGAVCDPEYLKERGGALDEFFLDTLAQGPEELQDRMRESRLLTPVTSTGNYSYLGGEIAGEKWLMIGDAYAFVDPVFSSGVLLAMHGAFDVVPAIDARLRGDDKGYRRAVGGYRRRHLRALGAFSWFINRFRTPAMKHLLMRPSNPLRVQEAVVSMLTGDVFHSPSVRWRLAIFRLIYAVTCLRYPRRPRTKRQRG